MYLKKILIFVIVLTVAVSICSCGFDESERKITGGELLNDERLSEIKDKILSTESDSDKEINSELSIGDKEKPNQTENDDSVETDTNSVTEESSMEGGFEVYWLEGGSVWHISPKCRYLENKEYISGTEDEAKEAGKSKICSSCGK